LSSADGVNHSEHTTHQRGKWMAIDKDLDFTHAKTGSLGNLQGFTSMAERRLVHRLTQPKACRAEVVEVRLDEAKMSLRFRLQ
jgi:hypothetical protein